MRNTAVAEVSQSVIVNKRRFADKHTVANRGGFIFNVIEQCFAYTGEYFTEQRKAVSAFKPAVNCASVFNIIFRIVVQFAVRKSVKGGQTAFKFDLITVVAKVAVAVSEVYYNIIFKLCAVRRNVCNYYVFSA